MQKTLIMRTSAGLNCEKLHLTDELAARVAVKSIPFVLARERLDEIKGTFMMMARTCTHMRICFFEHAHTRTNIKLRESGLDRALSEYIPFVLAHERLEEIKGIFMHAFAARVDIFKHAHARTCTHPRTL